MTLPCLDYGRLKVLRWRFRICVVILLYNFDYLKKREIKLRMVLKKNLKFHISYEKLLLYLVVFVYVIDFVPTLAYNKYN